MTATVKTARDEILGRFKTAWDADPISQDVLVLWPDVPGEVPSTSDDDGNPNAFARITVQHIGGQQASLANADGQRRWRRTGFVQVQIFTPFGTGLSLADDLTMITLGAFEGKDTASGVWFRDVRTREGVDEPENGWTMTSVIADFEYDEVK